MFFLWGIVQTYFLLMQFVILYFTDVCSLWTMSVPDAGYYVPDAGYSRNELCPLKYIFTVILSEIWCFLLNFAVIDVLRLS